MKTRIVFFIFILLASFYTFNHFKFKKSNHNIWDLVSSKSSIILELDDPFVQYNKMLKSSIIEKNLTEIKNDFDAFNLFLNNNIESFLNSNKIIISYFKLSDSKLEPIYLTYKGALDIDFIFKKIKESGVGIKERKFNNQIIYESIIEDKNYTFSIIDNIIILSKNSLLIEDAIRTKTNSKLQFKKNESDLFSQVKIKKDIGNLYINNPDIFDLLNIDSKNNLMSFIQKITPKKSFFDMKLEAQILRLNGFSSVSSESFNKDKSRHDSIIDILPYNTISYININSTNEKNFFKFNKKNKIEKFSENYKLEIGRAIIENSKSNKYDELVILKRKSSSDFQKTDSLLYDGIFKLDDQELNELINNKDTQDQREKFLAL